jgi:hypothetical protein
MNDKRRIIKKEEYFVRLEQGVPVGDCWVDMGNGELAYALQEVVVVGVPFNKYGDKFFEMRTVCICVADNTRIDTRQRDAQASFIEKQIEFDRRKKEVKDAIYKIVKDYFNREKPKTFGNNEKMQEIQLREIRMLYAIVHENIPLYFDDFPLELREKEMTLIKEFVNIRRNTANDTEITSKDTDNWWANLGTMIRMFVEWDLGLGAEKRVFVNDRVANSFRNAWKINEARERFYNKYADTPDLTGASVTNYKGDFGLPGLFKAGIDPIEQFVGGYRIDIYVIEENRLMFILSNNTSMNSFLYGIGPEWERSSFRLDGNMHQKYIFTEPIRR